MIVHAISIMGGAFNSILQVNVDSSLVHDNFNFDTHNTLCTNINYSIVSQYYLLKEGIKDHDQSLRSI